MISVYQRLRRTDKVNTKMVVLSLVRQAQSVWGSSGTDDETVQLLVIILYLNVVEVGFVLRSFAVDA